MAEVYEPVQLIVDNLVLSGLEANLASTNAVSKAYVDAHITSAVSSLVNAAPATLDTLKKSPLHWGMMQTSQLLLQTLSQAKALHALLLMLAYKHRSLLCQLRLVVVVDHLYNLRLALK